MGNIVTAISEEADKRTKEQLEMLQRMAQAQLDAQETNIFSGDEEIPTKTVVSKQKKIFIDASPDAGSLGKAVQEFFDGNIKPGFQDMIILGANSILGSTSIGEMESEDMFIAWENDVLLRIDIYYWKWNFSKKGIISRNQNVFAVFCMKRVVDMKKVDPQVLIWAISRAMPRDPRAKPEGEGIQGQNCHAIANCPT